MNSVTTSVQDVRDHVRSSVRAISLVAVGMCGTCWLALTHLRGCARNAYAFSAHVCVPTRAYRCPHVPHVPHNAYSASTSRPCMAARHPAHPAPTLARAFSSVTALVKKMNEGEGGHGF